MKIQSTDFSAVGALAAAQDITVAGTVIGAQDAIFLSTGAYDQSVTIRRAGW